MVWSGESSKRHSLKNLHNQNKTCLFYRTGCSLRPNSPLIALINSVITSSLIWTNSCIYLNWDIVPFAPWKVEGTQLSRWDTAYMTRFSMALSWLGTCPATYQQALRRWEHRSHFFGYEPTDLDPCRDAVIQDHLPPLYSAVGGIQDLKNPTHVYLSQLLQLSFSLHINHTFR